MRGRGLGLPRPDTDRRLRRRRGTGLPAAVHAVLHRGRDRDAGGHHRRVAGGRFSTIGLFAAAAVSGLWAGYELPPGERAGALVLGGVFTAVTLLPLALLPFALRKRRLAAKLVAEGATAIGTVTGVRDTGVTINRNPRVELTEAEYEAQKAKLLAES